MGMEWSIDWVCTVDLTVWILILIACHSAADFFISACQSCHSTAQWNPKTNSQGTWMLPPDPVRDARGRFVPVNDTITMSWCALCSFFSSPFHLDDFTGLGTFFPERQLPGVMLSLEIFRFS